MKRSFRSIRVRLTAVFILIILVIMTITVILHTRAMNAIRSSIYDEMLNNVVYFQSSLDERVRNITRLQMDFFQDRKLPFLSGTDSLLNDYERREAYLTVQERLRTITGISDLVEGGTLYFPKTGYSITESRIGQMTESQREEMNAHLEFGSSSPHVLNGRFTIASTGETRTNFSSRPNQLFVIEFSTQELIRLLGQLSEARDGGAFLYDESNQMLIASDEMTYADRIVESLSRDADGRYQSTQRIRAEGKMYLVQVQPTEYGRLWYRSHRNRR